MSLNLGFRLSGSVPKDCNHNCQSEQDELEEANPGANHGGKAFAFESQFGIKVRHFRSGQCAREDSQMSSVAIKDFPV